MIRPKIVPNVPGPCKGCEDRELYCHSHCERYKAWQEKREAIIAKLSAEREKDKDIIARWVRTKKVS